jgi:hypothetical protein
MADGHLFAVHPIGGPVSHSSGARWATIWWPWKIKIDPVIALPPLRAAQHLRRKTGARLPDHGPGRRGGSGGVLMAGLLDRSRGFAQRGARRLDGAVNPLDPRKSTDPMTDFSPREIVHELDRHIIGQADAKKAVAIALRNRWRRKRVGGSAARGNHAEKHPDDRPDRRRQDRDIPPSGQARRRALPEGGSHQIHRGWLCGPRCGFHRARPG